MSKPKFDIKNYPGKYVMAVGNEKNSKIFCEYLHSIGRGWRDDASYISRTSYEIYHEKTCYSFNMGTFSPIDYYVSANYTILYFDDFDWSDFTMKKFTRDDLKNGDVILRRDGSVEIVCYDTGTIICETGFNLLSDLRNDLTSFRDDGMGDVMEVRRPIEPCDCQFAAFESKLGALVYKREEVEEMTLEEVCKALGKEIKIVKSK